MKIRHVARSIDDQTLELLARRCAGQTMTEIARATGVAAGNVSLRTNRVKDADREYDPKDFQEGKYW